MSSARQLQLMKNDKLVSSCPEREAGAKQKRRDPMPMANNDELPHRMHTTKQISPTLSLVMAT